MEICDRNRVHANSDEQMCMQKEEELQKKQNKERPTSKGKKMKSKCTNLFDRNKTEKKKICMYTKKEIRRKRRRNDFIEHSEMGTLEKRVRVRRCIDSDIKDKLFVENIFLHPTHSLLDYCSRVVAVPRSRCVVWHSIWKLTREEK